VSYRAILLLAVAAASRSAADVAPSIEAFAARPNVASVAISPEGRYLSAIQTSEGKTAVAVFDQRREGWHAVLNEGDFWRLSWCRWASEQRLLCGLRGMLKTQDFVYAAGRLVAMDPDGRHAMPLLPAAIDSEGQFQDQIIDWHPGHPNTILVEADEPDLTRADQEVMHWGGVIIGKYYVSGYPAVYELNVLNGRTSVVENSHTSFRHYITDGHGHVRLAWGVRGTTYSYYARLAGESSWRPVSEYEAFSRGRSFRPVAISASSPNKAYALADYQGRDALWLIDLTAHDPPELLFSNPVADVTEPLIGTDGALIGVYYDTDRPHIYYTDAAATRYMDSVNKLLPDNFNFITGGTSDGQKLLIRSTSDKDDGSYYQTDTKSGALTRIGRAYPALDDRQLASLKPISIPARDGTLMPGYLALPPQGPQEHLPLVVMPHGGPRERDVWRYFFLWQFLTSRGYAVLQVNFRGSTGYGQQWFYSAHQDWGGLTYDDISDATRWAISQGIADPARTCIVGWSFGGYEALLGAVRDADLYRCAVSIAGISDLAQFVDQDKRLVLGAVLREQVGPDAKKLAANSPRLHAGDIHMPVLLVHGDRDSQVQVEQSDEMDKALTAAGKPHRYVRLAGADHQLSTAAASATLLREIESFLGSAIGPGVSSAP
jgi:dipeptidyl aminopeptidase/acylaminoacyl peptidase